MGIFQEEQILIIISSINWWSYFLSNKIPSDWCACYPYNLLNNLVQDNNSTLWMSKIWHGGIRDFTDRWWKGGKETQESLVDHRYLISVLVNRWSKSVFIKGRYYIPLYLVLRLLKFSFHFLKIYLKKDKAK